uniref:Uncharacterized protein n=1 Tax=Brassica campestris TaxID=3711 RepID=A0A3P5YQL8_BRACM|nr:unnamed protein product [Brassica rapa]
MERRFRDGSDNEGEVQDFSGKRFEDLSNFRKEEDRMCDWRNYGSVGATLLKIHR